MFPECRLPFPICTSSLSPRDMYPALFPSRSQTQIQKSQPSLCHPDRSGGICGSTLGANETHECNEPNPIRPSLVTFGECSPALFPSISQTQIQKSQPSLCHPGPQWRDLQFHSRSKRNSRMQGAICHLHFLISLGIHPSNRMREMQMGNRSLHSRASDRCQRSEWKKASPPQREGYGGGDSIRRYRWASSISRRVFLAKTTSCPRAIQVSKTTLPTS